MVWVEAQHRPGATRWEVKVVTVTFELHDISMREPCRWQFDLQVDVGCDMVVSTDVLYDGCDDLAPSVVTGNSNLSQLSDLGSNRNLVGWLGHLSSKSGVGIVDSYVFQNLCECFPEDCRNAILFVILRKEEALGLGIL